jgi:hypothetical protein
VCSWKEGAAYQSHRAIPGNPTFYFEQSLTILFSIDPVIIILGFAGSFVVIALERLKRDYTFLFWVVHFIIYALSIGYITDFHFAILYPIMCIAAGILLYRLVFLLKSPAIRTRLLSILVFSKVVYPKGIYAHNMMKVFLDNSLKMQVPLLSHNNIKVGIATFNALAEFRPIMISSDASISPSYKKPLYYNLLDFTDILF